MVENFVKKGESLYHLVKFTSFLHKRVRWESIKYLVEGCYQKKEHRFKKYNILLALMMQESKNTYYDPMTEVSFKVK